MTETGAMHLLKLIACECQVYGVAPMSLFVGKGWLVTHCSPLIGHWPGCLASDWLTRDMTECTRCQCHEDRGPGFCGI